MTSRKPIDIWPKIKFGGRPGYSAAHFARVSGEQDDPLRLAARLAARRQTFAERDAYWPQLCDSLELVIAELEAYGDEPGIKPFLRAARREQRVRT